MPSISQIILKVACGWMTLAGQKTFSHPSLGVGLLLLRSRRIDFPVFKFQKTCQKNNLHITKDLRSKKELIFTSAMFETCEKRSYLSLFTGHVEKKYFRGRFWKWGKAPKHHSWKHTWDEHLLQLFRIDFTKRGPSRAIIPKKDL